MRSTKLMVLLMMAMVVLAGPAALTAQEVLTNESVVTLVRSGLSESIVIAKIRSTATKFDLRTDALVALKRAGVSDKVIEAMVGAGSPATGTLPAPSPATQAAATLKDREVIYHLTGNRYVELTSAAAQMETNVAFFQQKSEIVLKGKKAEYRIGDRKPVFVSAYSPADAPLVRLKPGDEHDDRNLKIGSGAFHPFGGTQKFGVRNEDKVDVDAEKDSRGLYRISPKTALGPGEYGFIITHGFAAGGAGGKVYDFGVD